MEYMESKMQDYMEAGMNEHNELCVKLQPPEDWSLPKWRVEEKVHNWRNYVNEDVKIMWVELTGRQKLVLAANFKDIADREEWE